MIRTLFKETLIYGVALGVQQVSGLLLWPIYARIFSEQQLGALTLALSYQALLVVLGGFAMDNSAFRWYWEETDETRKDQVLSVWFLFQLFAAVLWGFVTLFISKLLFPSSPHLLLLASLSLIPRSLTNILAGYYRLVRAPLKFVGFNALQMFVGVGLVLLIIRFFPLPEMVFVGLFIGDFLTLMLFKGIWWKWRKWNNDSVFLLKSMLRYAFPLASSGLALWLLTKGDRWLVKIILGVEQTGVYQLGNVLSMGVGLPVMAFQRAWGPFALSLMGSEEAEKVYAKVADVFVLVSAVLAVIISLFIPEFSSIMFGKRYVDALKWAISLSFAQIFYGEYFIFAIGCNIAKDNTPISKAVWSGGGVKILLGAMLTYYFGLWGMGWAALLSNMIIAVYLFYQAQRIFPIPFQPKFLFLVPITTFFLVAMVLSFNLSLPVRLGIAWATVGGSGLLGGVYMKQRWFVEDKILYK